MTSVAKEFHRLMKRVGKLTDEQVTITDIDWDDGMLQNFNIIVRPNSGLYRNGKFDFEIRLLDEYPELPPVVWCRTEIYHPNIDTTEECYGDTTNVCLNLLEQGVWSRSFGLEGTVLGLLFLMHNPNLEDPLSPYFEGCDDKEFFENNVRKYMAGEKFDDMSFETGFCVKDGVLIKEGNDGESDKEEVNDGKPETEEINVPTDVRDPKTNETDNRAETDNAETTDTVETSAVTECRNDSENDSGTKEELNQDTHDKNNDILAEMCAENSASLSEKGTDKTETTAELGAEINDNLDNDDENDDTEIELVTLDGEFILFVHNSNTTNTENADACENTNAESNSKTDETRDNAEVNKESDIDCSASAASKDNITGTNDEGKINLLPRASASKKDEDDEVYESQNLSNQTKCQCGPWSTVRSVVCKIVHTVIQQKLYRDIGF